MVLLKALLVCVVAPAKCNPRELEQCEYMRSTAAAQQRGQGQAGQLPGAEGQLPPRPGQSQRTPDWVYP